MDIDKIIEEVNSLEDIPKFKPTKVIPYNIAPVHYLFDPYINDDIGGCEKYVYKLGSYIYNKYIKTDDYIIEQIVVDLHATAFFIFKKDNVEYLLYSNSGYGSENHYNTPTLVSFKYYEIVKKSYSEVISFINNIINQVKLSVADDTRQFSIDFTILDVSDIMYFNNMVRAIINFIKTDIVKFNYTNLLYAILIWLCNEGILKETTYSNIIEKDNVEIKINEESTLGIRCIYKKLCLSEYTPNKHILKGGNNILSNKCKEFMEALHKIDKKYDTLHFKLKHFNIEFDNLYGFLNYKQIGGSCTFYSIFNIIISFLLGSNKTVEECVYIFITIHYILLRLFVEKDCYSILPSIIHNHAYLISILKKNKALLELNAIYKNTEKIKYIFNNKEDKYNIYINSNNYRFEYIAGTKKYLETGRSELYGFLKSTYLGKMNIKDHKAWFDELLRLLNIYYKNINYSSTYISDISIIYYLYFRSLRADYNATILAQLSLFLLPYHPEKVNIFTLYELHESGDKRAYPYPEPEKHNFNILNKVFGIVDIIKVSNNLYNSVDTKFFEIDKIFTESIFHNCTITISQIESSKKYNIKDSLIGLNDYTFSHNIIYTNIERIYLLYGTNIYKDDFNIKDNFIRDYIINYIKTVDSFEVDSILVLILTGDLLLLSNSIESIDPYIIDYIRPTTAIIENYLNYISVEYLKYICINDKVEDIANIINYDTIEYKSTTYYKIKDASGYFDNCIIINKHLYSIGIYNLDVYDIYTSSKRGQVITNENYLLIRFIKYNNFIKIKLNGNCETVFNTFYKCDNITFSEMLYIKNNKEYKIILEHNYHINYFIPHLCPKIVYIDNDKIFMDIIITSIPFDNIKPLDKSKVFDYMYKIFTIELSPSYLFPVIKTFDYNLFKILNYYYSENIIGTLNNNIDINLSRLGSLKTKIKLINENIQKFNNININIDNKAFEKFKIYNKICNFNYNEHIDEEREIIIENDYSLTLFEFINLNMGSLLINMFIRLFNIYIKKIQENKDNCWEVQKYLSLLNNIYTFDIKDYTIYDLIFLLQNDYVFSKEQMDKYNEIKKTKTNTVYQFMMGKGKTSTITPLLCFNTKLNTKLNPLVITSDHLVNQTKQFMSIMEFLFNINIEVLSDGNAKKRWLENTHNYNGNYFLLKGNDKIDLSLDFNIIDEFDSHYDANQSYFNYVLESIPVKEELFNYVFNICFNIKYDSNQILKDYPKLKSCVMLYKKQAEDMKYNQDYGFEYITEQKEVIQRLCQPFSKKNTPVKHSNFNNILITLCCTFISYKEQFESKFNEYDIKNIYINYYLINVLFNSDGPELIISIMNKEYDKFKHKIQSLYTIDILRKYLYNVNISILKVTSKQANMSFQDIIYNNYNQRQVGYTGTTYLQMIDYNKFEINEPNLFTHIIIDDPDEKLELELALKQYGKEIKDTLDYSADVIKFDIQLKCIEHLSRGLIDLSGTLSKEENITIAGRLKTMLRDKNIIYFDNNHLPTGYEHNYTLNENNFYYYDQCHTVGTDLPHPRTGHFAIIIDNNTRVSKFMQAIFRFRNLNRGTYMSIIVDDDISNLRTTKEVETMLIRNENIYNEAQKDKLHLQLLKTVERKKTNDYSEVELKLDYELPEKSYTLADCLDRLSKNIINTGRLNENILRSIKDIEKLLFGATKELSTEVILQNEVKINIEINKNSNMLKDANHSVSYIKKIKNTNINLFLKLTSLDVFINDCPVYISKNLMYIDPDPFSFIIIEFTDKPKIVLIELESIAIDCYIDSFWVYDCNGRKMNVNKMPNIVEEPDILDIPINISTLLCMTRYINIYIVEMYNEESFIDFILSIEFSAMGTYLIYASVNNLYFKYKNRLNNLYCKVKPPPQVFERFKSEYAVNIRSVSCVADYHMSEEGSTNTYHYIKREDLLDTKDTINIIKTIEKPHILKYNKTDYSSKVYLKNIIKLYKYPIYDIVNNDYETSSNNINMLIKKSFVKHNINTAESAEYIISMYSRKNKLKIRILQIVDKVNGVYEVFREIDNTYTFNNKYINILKEGNNYSLVEF